MLIFMPMLFTGIAFAENNINSAKFLLNYYKVDGTGWGSPFLLVPEVTNVDNDTLEKLAIAKEEDYYLSNVSPLGVLFNNFKYVLRAINFYKINTIWQR